MFSGDVARDDRLRLEDRIDENVVAHDPLVPRGVNGPRTATAPRHASSYHTAFAQRVLTPSVVGARRRVADAAGHARQRPDLAVIGDADLAGAVVAALGIGPGIVALDADHKAAGKLVVAAGLRAAKPAV